MSELFGPRQKQSAVVLVLMIAGIAYMSLSKNNESPQAQVEKAVKEMVVGAEEGDTGPFKKHLSDKVQDHDGRDKQAILKLLTRLFFIYKDIQLSVINLNAEGGSNPDLIVARLSMLMGNASIIPTEHGNFILTFRREGERWRVWEIDWEDAASYGM